MDWKSLKNRKKVLLLAPQNIIDMLKWREGNTIRMPTVLNLPPDVEPVGVSIDVTRGCFQITLIHPDFAPVPFGLEPEIITPKIDYLYLHDKEIKDE